MTDFIPLRELYSLGLSSVNLLSLAPFYSLVLTFTQLIVFSLILNNLGCLHLLSLLITESTILSLFIWHFREEEKSAICIWLFKTLPMGFLFCHWDALIHGLPHIAHYL